MNSAQRIIKKFGGQTTLAAMLDKGQSTVQYWSSTGIIPAKWQTILLKLANENGIDLSVDEFISVAKSENTDHEGATQNTIIVEETSQKTPLEGAVPTKQLTLDLGIEIERDVNGIEMGVLENGIAFLSQRGLERIVGVTRKKLYDITNDWEEAYKTGYWAKERIGFVMDRLQEQGYMEPKLYLEVRKDGVLHYAYPDVVCMAILEYYALGNQKRSPYIH